ncbi:MULTISPECIES: DUF3343 domain-containing protein [Clostridium]|uniref:DUF3343 domain-containing protein n=1 Tax=Clostridium TaxID=1485 RepID=UPI000C073604|nr:MULTISPECIES: DUF3343 domain-containing protein [Clostridium]MBS7130929.1 DUF3343 domain-containing protein [Clostridium sp.]MDB2076979.1 DUF3343 domain-containing protein [Clostridium paraputrificum]MDB2080493.1 DUF3343 domain-containing protein [Clostridium paraputrificum]MDB2086542.1 DUF3343 domain-containing protein [Clostridium paraputrificum]MDB2094178.1 DUF3343 domain-containing protein [Clostridium paraputrificum]
MKYYIIVYKNTHDVMEAERNLTNANVEFRVMPTPTSITQSCGMCTRIESEEILNNIIERELVNYKNIYIRDKDGFKFMK